MLHLLALPKLILCKKNKKKSIGWLATLTKDNTITQSEQIYDTKGLTHYTQTNQAVLDLALSSCSWYCAIVFP